MTISAGTVLHERYRVQEVIGRGGMASVYRARDLLDGRTVAIKILHCPEDERERRRVLREARIGLSLRHENIITVFDVFVEQDIPHIVMECIAGTTLRERLDQKAITTDEGRRLLARVADALAYAHAKAIIHRDLKPSNIMITHDGRTKVGDWGLACSNEETAGITKTGIIVGTPAYLAPERLLNEKGTAASDVYALGCILFELYEGQTPYDGELTDILQGHLSGKLPPMKKALPQEDAFVRRLLARQPDIRPTAPEISQVLSHPPDRGHIEATQLVRRTPPSALSHRRTIRRTLLGIVSLALLCLISYLLLTTASTPTQKRLSAVTRHVQTIASFKHALRAFSNSPARVDAARSLRKSSLRHGPTVMFDCLFENLDRPQLEIFGRTLTPDSQRRAGRFLAALVTISCRNDYDGRNDGGAALAKLYSKFIEQIVTLHQYDIKALQRHSEQIAKTDKNALTSLIRQGIEFDNPGCKAFAHALEQWRKEANVDDRMGFFLTLLMAVCDSQVGRRTNARKGLTDLTGLQTNQQSTMYLEPLLRRYLVAQAEFFIHWYGGERKRALANADQLWRAGVPSTDATNVYLWARVAFAAVTMNFDPNVGNRQLAIERSRQILADVARQGPLADLHLLVLQDLRKFATDQEYAQFEQEFPELVKEPSPQSSVSADQ